VNASQVQCTVERGGVRIGLGYVKGAPRAEMQALVAERERGGPFTSLGELAGRVACGRSTLEQLAWSGACDSLIDEGQAQAADTRQGSARRTALWQLGVASPAEMVGQTGERAGVDARPAEGTQLALPMELPAPPRLRKLGRWQQLIADYSTSGVTVGEHALAILRERLTVPMLATSAQLPRLPSGCQVAVAGLVIARQRPGTAKGTTFLLFEDEFGTVNLIVPPAVYERHRQLARAEPLLLARGTLERAQGVVNVIVRELAPLERYVCGGVEGEQAGAGTARVHRLPEPVQDMDGGEVGASMRAAVPPMQSFGRGRRR
jgi:error-prone DNA polymerase